MCTNGESYMSMIAIVPHDRKPVKEHGDIRGTEVLDEMIKVSR